MLIAPDGFASPGFVYGKAPEVPAALKLMRYGLPGPVRRLNLTPAYADPAVPTDELAERYHALVLAPRSREAMLAWMQQTGWSIRCRCCAAFARRACWSGAKPTR